MTELSPYSKSWPSLPKTRMDESAVPALNWR